jgi:peptidoglycan/xylan/chitin deacetylase (PgdA/CDA1 family)
MRPPYGAVNPTVQSSVPLPLVLWNIDPRDWAESDPVKIEATVLSQVKPGAIVLMHDSKHATAAAVAALLAELKKKYRLVTVSELLHLDQNSHGQYFSMYTHR